MHSGFLVSVHSECVIMGNAGLIPALSISLSLSSVFLSLLYLFNKSKKALKIIIPLSEQITFGGFWPWEEERLSLVHYEYVTRFQSKNPVFTKHNSLGSRSSQYSCFWGCITEASYLKSQVKIWQVQCSKWELKSPW